MKKNFILFLACWLTTALAYGQVVFNEPFGSGSLPSGWTSVQQSGDGWKFSGNPGWGVANTPDHTPGGGTDYAWLDFSVTPGGRDAVAVLTTPGIDVSSLTTPALSFAYESYYAGGSATFIFNSLEVQAWNGTMWMNVQTYSGNTPQGWEVQLLNLTGFTYSSGDSVRIRFIADDGGDAFSYENDLLVDDVRVLEMPTCFPPNNLAAVNIQATSASITWNQPMGMPIGWQVSYGPAGITPGAGTFSFAALDSINLTGLMGSTDYVAFVRAICAPGDTSAWSGVIPFRTLCAPQVPTYSYPFNDFINNDPCWSEATGVLTTNTVLSGTTSSWVEDGFGNVGTQDAARMNLYDNRAEWLISESIDLGVGTPYQLEFDIALVDYNTTNPTTLDGDDTIAVVISVDNGATWSSNNVLRQWVAGSEPSNTGDRIIIDLSAYSGVVKFGFYTRSVATNPADNDVSIDNMVVTNFVTCNAPSALTVGAITNNAASLGWTENNLAPSWQIEYGQTGFAQGSGTTMIVGTNPAPVSGLMGNTTYDFYVRSICAPGDTSAWSAVGTFTTNCDPLTAPYVQPFATDALPACWIQGGDNAWEYGSVNGTTPAGFADYGAANVRDHSPSGNGTFIGMDGSDNANGDISTLLSPSIDVSGLTNGEVSFWVFSNNIDDNAQNELLVELYDGAAWNTIHTIQGNNPSWIRYATSLAGFTITGPIQVRFTVTGVANGGSTFYNDILIDDVIVDNPPPCLNPSALNFSNVTSNSVEFGWTSFGSNNWEVEYGPTGFTLGTGTNVRTGSNPFPANNLMPATGYDFYVRSLCAPGDSSGWEGPANVVTACPPSFEPPYLEEFNAYPAACWTEFTGRFGTPLTSSNSSWSGVDFGNVSGPGRESAGFNLYSSGADEWLVSPSIDLGAANIPYQIEFDIALTAYSTTNASTFDNDDTVGVAISTDNGVTWRYLRTWTAGSEPSNTGDHIIIDVSGFTGLVQFGFYAASNTFTADNDIFIDNFEVGLLAGPSDLVINEIMYNPPEGGTDSTEFIEIYNNGATAVDLSNFSFTQGVVFTFPGDILPVGGYYVVTVDTTAFFNTFGFPADAQWTSGGLRNGGEDIVLADNNGVTLDSVDYEPSAPWPAGTTVGRPNGGGSSLILCDPNTDNVDAANWGFSFNNAATNADGDVIFASPGAANTCGTDAVADQFLNLDTVYCGASSLSGSFVVTNASNRDANNVVYIITAGGSPIANGSIPVLAANSSDTINVGPVPVVTGSATLQAVVAVANDTDTSNNILSQDVFVSNTAANITATTGISCNGASDGVLAANATGGIGNYTYMWNNMGNTASISGLSAGTYVVTVTDSVNCPAVDTFVLTEPMVITITDTVTDVACNGAATGMIDITATMGGTAPFTYDWSNNATTSAISNLTAGSYDVTITDANGCTFNEAYVITEPSAISITDTVTNVVCNGAATGMIDITTTSGGVGPYTYDWSNNATTSMINNLVAGPYDVTITDANGCTFNQSYTISEPMPISITDAVTNIACFGDSTGMIDIAATMGGTAPYTYAWSNNATTSMIGNLAAGPYDVTITDASGCTFTQSYTITEPAQLSLTLTDNADGSATAGATGGTTPYTYQWDANAGSQTTATATGLTNANTYSAVVTDANGCTATDTVTIRIISVNTIDKASSIAIFPNPTSGNVFVDVALTQDQPVQIELYNAVGQRVLAQALGTVQETRVELQTAQLPAGVYLVHLTIGEERITRKLVVDRL